MGYGMTARNTSGELTFSSDGMVFGYIGKATNTAVAQAGTSGVDDFAGYSTYTITWAGAIIVVLPLEINKPVALRSVSQSGSTWTITVHHGTGSLDAQGFNVESAVDVFVFGAPTSVSGWGAAIRNSAGTLTGDLSRRPLFFNQLIDFTSGQITATIGSYTKPAFIGYEPSLIVTTQNVGGPTPWLNRIVSGGWTLGTSTRLDRASILSNRLKDDGPLTPSTSRPAVGVVLIEADGLT